MSTLHAFKGQAIDKGFRVEESEELGGWVIRLPRKPRVPAHTQGSFKSSDRAWMAAASLAKDYPTL
jgi:hypothetical protein